jgi:tetratricopeptide (TPR) repeat protein
LLLSAAVAAPLPGVANAAWYQASSKHFVVYSDDTADHIKAFTERLERFDQAIRYWHKTPEDTRGPSARVTIYVVGDVAAVQKIYGKGGSGVAGFYDPRATGSVAFTPRSTGSDSLTAQAILFHEYTHHFMLTNWTDAAFPPWLTEGFAELHATAQIGSDGSVRFGAVPIYRQWTVNKSNLLPAAQLIEPYPGKLDEESRDALYSRGWLLTHYLTFDPARRKQLADYITAINTGKPAKEAAKAFGKLSELDGKMNAWATSRSMPYNVINGSELKIGPISARPLTPAESATMPALIASQRGVDDKTAPVVAELARRLAAPFPNDPAAQNELAEAEYDAKNYDAAKVAAERALAADPQSVHALLYKGMAQQAVLVRDKVTDKDRWAAVRRSYLAANKVDTQAPQPLVLFYNSFIEAKGKPTENAENGLLYAYQLAPYDPFLRLQAAAILIGFDEAKARIALYPVAYNIEERIPALIAQKALKALDAGDKDAARKALTPPYEVKDDAKKS